MTASSTPAVADFLAQPDSYLVQNRDDRFVGHTFTCYGQQEDGTTFYQPGMMTLPSILMWFSPWSDFLPPAFAPYIQDSRDGYLTGNSVSVSIYLDPTTIHSDNT